MFRFIHRLMIALLILASIGVLVVGIIGWDQPLVCWAQGETKPNAGDGVLATVHRGKAVARWQRGTDEPIWEYESKHDWVVGGWRHTITNNIVVGWKTGWVPVSSTETFEVTVRLGFLLPLFLAYPLIAWYRARRRAARLAEGQRCASCGYELRGLTEPRCPECGTAFERKNAIPHDATANPRPDTTEAR